MCLVTGEDIPDVGESGLGRFFLIPLSRGDINSKKLRELQDNTGLLAQNMANYIDWIRPKIDCMKNVASEILNRTRDELAELHQLQGRSPETLAFLILGFDMFLEYCESVGALAVDDRAELYKKGQKALVKLSCSFADKIVEEKPTEKFFTALRELIVSQRVEILPIEEVPRIGNLNFIGWSDLLNYYLIPETTYTQIVKFYSEQGVNFPVTKNRLWQDLVDDGHVIPDNKQSTRKKKINNKYVRVIWLKCDSLQVKE